ncbi:MAG: glycosyltransferase family 1 protein [Nostocoides sp.]
MSLDLPPAGPGEVVTVHDLAWTYPDEARPVTAAVDELDRAAAVITVSEFSADECVRHLGISRPHVIPNGVDPRFYDAPPTSAEVLATHGIRIPFVLCAGGATRRKNLAALAAAWPRVRSQHPGLTLVLTGPPDPRRTALFADLDGTVLPGRLPNSLLPGLVAAAGCLVVPSLYEGFGLPALEAMAAGTPVVASRASSLPEVVGDGGWLVTPDADGLADGIGQVMAGGPEVEAATARGRARASRFTWERSAAAHAKIWTEVAESRH